MKAGFALIRVSGMQDKVISIHRTQDAAEAAMVKRGGIPRSCFTNGLGVMRFGSGSSYELVDTECTGRFLRPVLR